mgnify:CR=1 FL=1
MLLGLSDFRAPFSMPLEGASLMPTPHLFGYNILCQDTTLQVYGIMADRGQRVWALHMRLLRRALREHNRYTRPQLGVSERTVSKRVEAGKPPILPFPAPKPYTNPIVHTPPPTGRYKRMGVTNTLTAVWYVG